MITNKLLTGLMALAFILLLAVFWSAAYAKSVRDITIQWDAVNATDLDVYQVRINADNSTMVDVPAAATVWAGTLTLLDDQNTIEVRAKDLAGQVGPWSDPAYYDPVPSKPNITIIIFSD